MKASIVIPVLNECGNLKVLLPELIRPGWEILICDNGSYDGTVQLVENAVTQGVKLNKGTGSVTDAILRGLKEASGDKIIVMDADLSHPPGVVSRLVDALDEHDIVIASRYCKGGGSKDTFRNRFISKGFNLLALGLFLGIKDRASGFWGIRKSLTSVTIRDTVKPMLEFLVRSKPTSVVEVPYTFSPRTWGEGKLGKPVRKTLFDLICLYFRRYRRFVRFCIVGGIGSLIYIGSTLLFTLLLGLKGVIVGAVVGAIIALVWNYTGHKVWTFSEGGGLNNVWNLGHKNGDGDFDYWEWYSSHPIKRYWKRKMGSLVKELAGNPDHILSLGCGSSPVINMFHCSRMGVEISKDKVDFIRGHSTATFAVADITTMTLVDKVDCILCNEVLEHLDLEEIEGVVKLISGGLVSEGKVVISSPDYSIWYGKILENLFHGKFHHEFSFENLDMLCNKYGLKKVRSKRFLWDTCVCYLKGK